MNPVADAADQFKAQNRVMDIRVHGKGNIHETYLVTLDGRGESRFILQRLNQRVFPQPVLIIQNVQAVTEHILGHPERSALIPGCRWEFPFLVPAKDGHYYWIDSGGSFWRAMRFIARACSFDTIKDLNHARAVGQALGFFHSLIHDLPLHKLADTLPEFHIAPTYLKRYDQVLASHPPPDSQETDFCLRFIERQRSGVAVLEEAKNRGHLHLRPIHGDPKANNVLMDPATGRAVSLIDLDTIKPGLIHYDIGDCLRSCGNPLGEETRDWQRAYFDPNIGRALLEGYYSLAGEFLQDQDYEYLYAALHLIAFELGLRFFTDYLAGNLYFKVHHEKHNLSRALVQFRLTQSIEAQAETLQSVIRKMQCKK